MNSPPSFHLLSEDAAFIGPPFSAGPLPTLFYFSLSAEDSLCLDPFNQPVRYLSSFPLRIFSLSLPHHKKNLPPQEALSAWAQKMTMGHSILDEIIEKTKNQVDFLLKEHLILENKLAIAGLSRGAFIATHIAAHIPLFQTVLGFAPLIHLHQANEFHSLQEEPLVQSLSLEHLIPQLTHHHLRFYIGNLDRRVNTRSCFDFIEKLSLMAHLNAVRSPQAELILFPSIGKDGHGTPQEIFHQGALWIAKKLGVVHDL